MKTKINKITIPKMLLKMRIWRSSRRVINWAIPCSIIIAVLMHSSPKGTKCWSLLQNTLEYKRFLTIEKRAPNPSNVIAVIIIKNNLKWSWKLHRYPTRCFRLLLRLQPQKQKKNGTFENSFADIFWKRSIEAVKSVEKFPDWFFAMFLFRLIEQNF